MQKPFDFQANMICQDFVYLQMKSSKLLMARPGEWINQKMFEKLHGLQKSLIIESVVDNQIKEKFKSLLQTHLKAKFQSEINSSVTELMETFQTYMRHGGAFYSWAQSCFEVMSKVSDEQINEMNEVDLKLVKKAYLTAALAVWLSCINGLHYPSFLEDIYHLAFFQDVGLISEGYSFYVMEAIEKEHELPGSGYLHLLDMKASEDEIDLYRNHPLKSFDYLSKLEILNNQELSHALLTQHEVSSGEGFLGFSESVLSTWEEILILSDQLVPYQSLDYYDVGEGLNSLKEDKISSLPVKKVVSKAKSFFSDSSLKESA